MSEFGEDSKALVTEGLEFDSGEFQLRVVTDGLLGAFVEAPVVASVFYAHSFDFYATANINQMGWSAGASSASVSYLIGPFGRNNTQGLRLAREDTSDLTAIAQAIRNYTATQTPINGVAFQTNAYPPANFPRLLLSVLDGSTSQVDLYLLHDGTFQVQSNAVVLGTTTYTIGLNFWYYLELKVLVDPAVGTVDLLIDDGEFLSFNILSLTAQNTQVSGNASSDSVGLRHLSSIVNDVSYHLFDDFYHTDPSDAVYPDTIGNIYVFAHYARDNGVHVDFDPVNAPIEYQAINEALENEDATYITSAHVGDQATFSPVPTAKTSDILAIELTHISKQETAGVRELAPEWTISGVDYVGPSRVLTPDYAAYELAYTRSPRTSLKWLSTEFNAAQFGEKATA